MKVLFVTHYSELLGANRSLLALIKYLKENSNYTPIVLLPCKGKLVDELIDSDIAYYKCPIFVSIYNRRNLPNILKGLLKEILNILISLYLYFKLKNHGISIIHTNSSVTNLGAYLAFLLKIPHVWHFREFAKKHYDCYFNFGEVYQKYVWSKFSSIIVTVSNSLKEYYCQQLNKTEIVTVYNGINLPEVINENKEKGIFHIAVTGRIYLGKHQDVVLKAMNDVIYNYGIKDIHLHVYGDFESECYKTVILKMVQQLKLDNFVTFYGYTKDVVSQSRFCHIGILASEYEAFGRVTIEYMVNGMIPIVSDSGANTEIITDGENGFIFKLNDAADLAKCIHNVIVNYNAYDYIVQNALQTSKMYSASSNANQIISLYNKILEQV